MIRYVQPLPDELAEQLRKLGRSAGVSLFVVLLTAFKALMLRWSGEPEPVIGTLAANRPTADSAEGLGAHYNPLLLSTSLDGDPSLAEALLRTSADAVSALDRQELPYAVLSHTLSRELGWAENGTPAAMLLVDRYPMEGLKLKGCKVTGLYLDDGMGGSGGHAPDLAAATTAGLTVFVREAGEQLTVTVLSPRGTLGDTEVASLTQAYTELLAALCETPEVPLSEVELSLSDGARSLVPHAPRSQATPTLREITRLAPVEALSPVGVWAPIP